MERRREEIYLPLPTSVLFKCILNKKYLKIIQSLPISCVDIIIKNKNDEYLLVIKIEPLKNHYFLIGGRVYLNETLSAAKRKLNEELNQNKFEFIGVYQDF